jgi:hypothetical protein
MLQEFAATHNVKMVVVSIGGNDFNFADVVQSCVTELPCLVVVWPDYCYDDSSVTSNFTCDQCRVRCGPRSPRPDRNVRQAMRNAGYADTAWTLRGADLHVADPGRSSASATASPATPARTPAAAASGTRTPTGPTATALPTINGAVAGAVADSGLAGVKVLDLQSAFNGRRLCENTVGLLEEKGLASWTQAGAVDKTEWIDQIRTVSTATSNYYIQESLHPNYWGQLAIRNCVRQAWNGAHVQGRRRAPSPAPGCSTVSPG